MAKQQDTGDLKIKVASLVVMKANSFLGCIRRSIIRRSREVILLLASGRGHTGVLGPVHQNDTDLMLLPNKEGLGDLGLFSLEEKRLRSISMCINI